MNVRIQKTDARFYQTALSPYRNTDRTKYQHLANVEAVTLVSLALTDLQFGCVGQIQVTFLSELYLLYMEKQKCHRLDIQLFNS